MSSLYLLRLGYGIGQLQYATLPQYTFPQLYADNAEYEKDKETQEKNVS